MDNYFTTFRLLTHLGVNMCAQQKQVTQMHCHWGQTAAKKINVATLNSAAHIKQKSSVTGVVG